MTAFQVQVVCVRGLGGGRCSWTALLRARAGWRTVQLDCIAACGVWVPDGAGGRSTGWACVRVLHTLHWAAGVTARRAETAGYGVGVGGSCDVSLDT